MLAIAALTTAASATPVVHFDINVLGGTGGPYNNSFDQAGVATVNPQVFNYHSDPGGLNAPNGEWSILSWDFNADQDPSGSGAETGARIGSAFTVQNNRPDGLTPADNHLFFSIMVTLPISPLAVGTSFFGNGGMTLTIDDSPNNFPGELKSVGGPMWNYRVNGSDVASLFPSGFVLGGSDGPTTASTSGNLSAAQTAPLVGMTPTTLGIRLDFDLTPGERVTFNGVFGFVPTPGALALLGLAGLTSRRRRN